MPAPAPDKAKVTALEPGDKRSGPHALLLGSPQPGGWSGLLTVATSLLSPPQPSQPPEHLLAASIPPSVLAIQCVLFQACPRVSASLGLSPGASAACPGHGSTGPTPCGAYVTTERACYLQPSSTEECRTRKRTARRCAAQGKDAGARYPSPAVCPQKQIQQSFEATSHSSP